LQQNRKCIAKTDSEGGNMGNGRDKKQGRTKPNGSMVGGMGGYVVVTLDVVAAELGISRERVRQIEARAWDKVRKILLERGVNFDDLV
jgi:hypothetical protein